jgi:hypothetical protein
LRENQFLQKLILKANNIRDEGGLALASAMKKNETILQLDINFNNFDYKFNAVIDLFLKENLKKFTQAGQRRLMRVIKELQVSILLNS